MEHKALGKDFRKSFFTGAASRTRKRLIIEFDREVDALGGRAAMLAIYDRNAAYEKELLKPKPEPKLDHCASNVDAYRLGQHAADELPLSAGMDSRPALQSRSK